MGYHGADDSLTTVGANRFMESDPSHDPVILATKRLNTKIGLQLSEVLPASLPALRQRPSDRDRTLNALPRNPGALIVPELLAYDLEQILR